VLEINGRSSAEIIAADDFNALTADSVGQALTLKLRTNGSDRTLTLRSDVFSLSPVSPSRNTTVPGA
jgi:hypothetical protein